MLDVNDGNVKTTITFYNFSATGQKEIDNIVAQSSYADMVFPKLKFLNNDVMAAFGNGRVVIFEGSQSPQVKKEIVAEQEIRSIFYNEAYIGLVFENQNTKARYKMQVYDLNGNEVLSKDFNVEYREIGFLENDEICVRGDTECILYTLHGVEKFHGSFEKNIWKVLSTGRIKDYIFLTEGQTQRIRLK